MKETFKTGMMFKSKTHPHYDFVIDFVSYNRASDDEYGSIICWYRTNDEEFDKFVFKKKGVSCIQELLDSGKNTFPYTFAGEGMPKSIKAMVHKYNMEHVGNIDKKIRVYEDNELGFSSGFEEN